MNRVQLQRTVVKSFSLHGLVLQRDATKYLIDNLLAEAQQPLGMLNQLIAALKESQLKSTIIETSTIRNLFAELEANAQPQPQSQSQPQQQSEVDFENASTVDPDAMTLDDQATGDYSSASLNEVGFPPTSFGVLSAFEFPKFAFDPHRKSFILRESRGELHGNASDKREMYVQRLRALHQRIARHKMFVKPVLPYGYNNGGQSNDPSDSPYYELTPIESLVGEGHTNANESHVNRNRKRKMRCVMGLLSQLQEGKFFLEDLHGRVAIDLSNASTTIGMFTEGCIVLAEGEMDLDAKDGSEVFRVSVLGSPPAEPRSEALKYFNSSAGTNHEMGCRSFDAFGLHPSYVFMKNFKTGLFEASLNAAFIVTLSELWMDSPRVVEKFKTLLHLYENDRSSLPPHTFVLMGNFVSPSSYRGDPNSGSQQQNQTNQSNSAARVLRRCLAELVEIIAGFDRISRFSRFIIVPGPGDLASTCGPVVLPRPPFPKVLTQGLQDKLPNGHLHFASNPCRVRCFDQQIVVFREDLLNKMRRNCIVPPNETCDPDLPTHLVRTLVDQGHLSPLPQVVRPVYWNYEYALHLYPQPDILLLADRCDRYEVTYQGCLAFNVGTFASDFGFVKYELGSKRQSVLRVPDVDSFDTE